jgi:predicted nuclease of predicted toxin-antitoxin system
VRVLLDENMPLDYCELLPGHDCDHIETLGHKGIQNGALLKLARQHFDAFVTLDKGIQYQHNHSGHSLIIVVIRTANSNPDRIKSRAKDLLKTLDHAEAGAVIELAI